MGWRLFFCESLEPESGIFVWRVVSEETGWVSPGWRADLDAARGALRGLPLRT